MAKHHIVSFSGGACSFWAAHRVVQEHGTGNVTLLFADTLMEDEDLYRFNKDAERLLQKELTVISDGRNPWQLFMDERMIGNSRIDLCSKNLKRNLLWRWVKKRYKPSECVVHLGLDWTEEHRLKKVRERMPGWDVQAPMMFPPLLDKCAMTKAMEKIGLAPPRLYGMGFPHNNCGGFCVKAGQAQFALLLKTMPERYAWHECREQDAREHIGKDVSILKRVKDKVTHPMTLRDFRKRVESGEWYDKTDWGGCGCAIDSSDTEEQKAVEADWI